MNNSMTKVRCGLMMGSSVLVLMTSSGIANAASLFDDQGLIRAGNAAHIQSSRDVKINRGALQQASLTFDLFGEQVTAIRDSIERQKAGVAIWVGHIQGNPADTVIITATRSTYSGVIHHNGDVYELSGNGRGLQSLNKIEVANLPLEDLEGIPDGGGLTGASLAQDTSTAQADAIPQDLLVVYTQQACTAVGGAGDTNCDQIQANIATAVSDLNAAYAASNIDISMNLVGTALTNYKGTGASSTLGALRSTSDGQMDEVHPLRDSLGADLVALIYDGDGCGIGYSPSSPSSAFSVTKYTCLVGNRTMAHEIGHNQGALHDRAQHNGGTSGAYNYGFRRCNDSSNENIGSPYFRTVMSYSCSGAPRVGRFSHPGVNYLGVPQGIDHTIDPDNGRWNALTLNNSASYVSGFRDAPVPQTPPAAPTSLSALATGPDTIDISWNDNADNENEFQLQSSTDGSTWSTIATLGANAQSHVDNGLNADATYFYRVRARNGAGDSIYSNTGSATTETIPDTVDALALNQSPGAGSVSGSYTATHADDGSVQTITEVSSGGPKRRRKQSYSHIWNFDVLGGAGGVSLAANAYVSGAEGANFHYSNDNGSTWNLMFTVNENASSTQKSFIFPGGTSGPIQIRTTDAAQTNGEGVDSVSIDSLIITSNTIPGAPPSAPTNMTIGAVGSTSVDLSFTDTADNEFGFEIWRSLLNPGASCAAGSSIASLGANAGTGSLNYTDNSASPSTSYWYFAKAFNGAGDGGLCSNAPNATTQAGSAITASGNGYKIKGRQNVDLTWSGVVGGNVDIVRNGNVVATTNNDGAYTDAIGAKGGATYTYEVCEAGSSSACSASFQIVF